LLAGEKILPNLDLPSCSLLFLPSHSTRTFANSASNFLKKASPLTGRATTGENYLHLFTSTFNCHVADSSAAPLFLVILNRCFTSFTEIHHHEVIMA